MPFRLEKDVLNLGPVAHGSRVAGEIPFTFSGNRLPVFRAKHPDWLTVRAKKSGTGTGTLHVRAHTRRLAAPGTADGVIALHADGETQHVTVVVQSQAPQAGNRDDRSTRSQRAQRRNADSVTILPGLSLILGAAVLLSVVAALMSVSATSSGSAMPAGQALSGQPYPVDWTIVGAGFCLYLAIAFWRTFPFAGRRISSSDAAPQDRDLREILADMCGRMRAGTPNLAVLPSAAINVKSYGFWPSLATVYVSQGALQALSRDNMRAALAHEVAHLKRFDTFFLSAVSPFMALAGLFVGLVQAVFGGADRAGRNMNFSPFFLMMMLTRGGGGVGCLVGLFMMVAIAIALAVFASYLLGALAATLVASGVILAYSRHAEFRADAAAARALGGPQPIIQALGATVPQYADEMQLIGQFAANYVGSSQYGMNEIADVFRNDPSATAGVPLTPRFFRSHPFVIQRVASLFGR